MVDIEDLRLPVTMAKLDYFLGSWQVAPIAILEQRFTKNGKIAHDRVNMFATALNYLNGSWLFKSELAYFNRLKFN